MTLILQNDQAPFDGIAETYDGDFENNWVTRSLRERIYRRFLDTFGPSEHILELNCGTGTDALYLAQRGVRVTAFDESPAMIDQARRKLDRNHSAHLVTLHTMPFANISAFPDAQFDGAFSNFGGVNCVGDITPILDETARVLKPGSRFILCILNKLCAWESAAFLIRGDFGRAARRWHHAPVSARIGSGSIPTWYFSPGEIARRSSPHFTLVSTCGLSIISPSPNSKSLITGHPHLVRTLLALEERVCHLYPFRSLGDHAVLELIRRSP